MTLEPVSRPVAGIGEVASSLSASHFAHALVALVFAASAPVAIILGVGVAGGLSESDLASWIFAAFALNGVLTIVVSLLYRTPLAFFWTIPGTVLVGPALSHLSFAEVIGAFYATGLLLLVLGLTGSVRRVMAYLPMSIIMAMVAGVFLQFGLDWIDAFKEDIWITLPMTAVFFALPLFPGLARGLPPMIGVLIVGVVAMVLAGRAPTPTLEGAGGIDAWLATPNIYAPEFSIRAMIELVIPLAVTVIAAQNAQGVAILQSSDYRPPVNTITTSCGLLSLVTADNFAPFRLFRPVLSWDVTMSFVLFCSRCSSVSPTHKMGSSPPEIAAETFLLTSSSFSPMTCRRSEWPQMTYVHPISLSITGLISPVKAPDLSKYISWAPMAMCDLLMALNTGCRYTKGGHIATSAVSPARPEVFSAISVARETLLKLSVFIFQLPATNGFRIKNS